MRYRGDTLAAAAAAVLAELRTIGGEGGIVGVDTLGAAVLSFNGEGMYRGKIDAEGVALTAVYQDALRSSAS
jgi:beta-aspartyl-peptidase (threonine type)